MSSVYPESLDRIPSRGGVARGAGVSKGDWPDLVVDARNAVTRRAPHVFRLGAPAPVLVRGSDAEAAVAQAA